MIIWHLDVNIDSLFHHSSNIILFFFLLIPTSLKAKKMLSEKSLKNIHKEYDVVRESWEVL